MHKWMVPVAVVAAIWLVTVADSGLAKWVAAAYGIASVGLYSVSAAAHYKIRDAESLHLLFQLDHSMILVFFIASTGPVSFAMGGGSGLLLYIGMAVGTGVGLVAIWLPFHPPRGFINTLFFTIGWWPVLFAFPLTRGLGAGGLAILLGGGAIFTIGALIVGSRRPDPNPHVFGYHEIWHIFVIAGNSVHYVLAYFVVTGQTPL
ncbi:MAG: hemolysin III [Verrucomicrobiales bacterium]|jgi:hemolysin III